MEREADNRLQELFDSGVSVYSISRLDSINNCLYGAYRTYILNDRGTNNIYAILGGKTHDTLEKIVNGEATEDDLLPVIQEELDDMDMLGIEFPKDKNGGDSIKDGWVTNMKHFATTYKSPKNKNLSTEELFIYTSPKGRKLQGYIDLQDISNNGSSINIYDYKTSSMYSSSDLLNHGRQLVVYQLGKEQEGKTVGTVAWIMLKYVNITFKGKKTARSKEKTEITKTIERKKIGSELSSYIEQDLYEAGYDEIDSEIILNEFKKTNKFDCLPENIACNYKMKPCVLKYEVTQDVKDECETYIDKTIDLWESLNPNDVSQFPPRNFTKVQKNGKIVDDIFFCTSLCGHFKNCPYIHDYLDSKDNNNSEEEDLF